MNQMYLRLLSYLTCLHSLRNNYHINTSKINAVAVLMTTAQTLSLR